VYTPEDIGREVEAVADCDLILVDTAGFSHKNDSQREDMQTLLESLPEEYERDIYLVLSATTKYKDLVEITDSYQAYCRFALIFTKLDETGAYGNIYNIRMHTQAPLSYITTGQNVPDDMEEVDTQKLVKQLLGGK
jgi:flagellar biosynthesis protein FlhF